MVKEHRPGYSARDREVVDYQMYEVPGSDLAFRGPPPKLDPGRYVTCLGAAQTFGCLCEQPYPALLSDALDMECVNFGYGGAGPRFFNRHARLIEIANAGRLTIVQVMSGRSEDNALFESRGLEVLTRRRDGRRMSADGAWRSVMEMNYAWKRFPLGRSWMRGVCHRWAKPKVESLVAETRRNWVESYRQLFTALEGPTVLLWFSKRSPDYVEDFATLEGTFSAYPQLVNRAMVEEVAPLADAYVECVTQRGSPQLLICRWTGSPVEIDLGDDRQDFAGQKWTHNAYYPSPQMHEDAAAALAPVVQEVVQSERALEHS